MQPIYLEHLVEAYFLQHRGTLIAPQYLIRVDGPDYYPDILAVRPKENTVFLLEVTESRSARTLLPKLTAYRKFATETAQRLCREFGLAGDRWKIMPWIVIRREDEAAFRIPLEAAGFGWRQDICCTFFDELLKRVDVGTENLDESIWGKRTKIQHGLESTEVL